MPADLSPLSLFLGALVLAAGCFLQGAAGFGAALVAAPILALIDPRLVPGPLLMACFLLTVLMALRDREDMDLEGLGWGLAGRIPGTLAGAWVLKVSTADSLALALGVLVLLAVVMSAAGPALRPTRNSLFAAGIVSGFMGTTTSVGGPPMALLYQHSPGARLRGTLAAYFVVGALISLAGMAAVGRFGAAEAKWGLAMMPGVVLGFVLSGKAAEYLDGGRTRTVVLAVSALSGVALIARELLA